MAKIIKYGFAIDGVHCGTKELHCPIETDFEINLPIAQEEAYDGEYTIEGEFDRPTAPHNILEGEYVTIDGVLYKATTNIPNGETIIVGQNAVATTIEEQLYELKGE